MGIYRRPNIDFQSDGNELKIDGVGVTATAAEINAIAGAGLSAAEFGILDGATVTTAELNILDGVTATAAQLNAGSVAQTVTIPLQSVLGTRMGNNGNGLAIGHLGNDAIDAFVHEDNSSATFTDDTTDATSSGAADVTIPDPFDTSDALYFGHGEPFAVLQTVVSTAGAGDAVAAETDWEYWNGSAWASLTMVTDDSSEFTAGTATYLTSFLPPSDWATTTINSQGPFYYIRFIASADDVYNTTNPVFTRFRPFVFEATSVYKGISMPATGTINRVEFNANTISATNNDTVIVLINMTQNTYKQLTWTKGTVVDDNSSVGLAVTAGDEIALQVVQEDGSTEFDNAFVSLTIDL